MRQEITYEEFTEKLIGKTICVENFTEAGDLKNSYYCLDITNLYPDGWTPIDWVESKRIIEKGPKETYIVDLGTRVGVNSVGEKSKFYIIAKEEALEEIKNTFNKIIKLD